MVTSLKVYELIDQVLRRMSESTSSPKLISRLDVLDALNEGRQAIGELMGPIEGQDRIKALNGQYRYDKPNDFKSNLKRVEFDGLALTKTNLGILDEYDDEWRLSTERNPPDTGPKYFVPLEDEENRFIIYPPPGEDGEQWVTDGSGIPEDITLYGVTYQISDGAGGWVETVDIAGERFIFSDPGFPEDITPQKKNIRIFYDKNILAFEASVANESSSTSNKTSLEALLFPHWNLIMHYALSALYAYGSVNNPDKAKWHFDKFDLASKGLVDKVNLDRPGMRVTGLRKENYMWGKRR